MALDKSRLKQKIITNLEAKGFVTSGEFALSAQLADAIAQAVVDEITQNAQAIITEGSSAGSYSIK